MNLDFFLNRPFSCPECRSEMVRTTGPMRFEDGEIKIEIADVPILKCVACGHEYVPGPVARDLSVLINDVAEDMRKAPIAKSTLQASYAKTGQASFAFAVAD